MDKQLFNLKFAGKRLERAAKRCHKEEEQEKAKLKRAMLSQNPDGARVHAEAAVRKRHEATSYLRLASRIDAVASRLQTAVSMRTVSDSMRLVVNGLEKALDANKLDEVSALMGRFEAQSDSLTVQADSLEGVVKGSVPGCQNSDEVQLLLQQVADEHGLAVDSALVISAIPDRKPVLRDAEGLEERLSKLRDL